MGSSLHIQRYDIDWGAKIGGLSWLYLYKVQPYPKCSGLTAYAFWLSEKKPIIKINFAHRFSLFFKTFRKENARYTLHG